MIHADCVRLLNATTGETFLRKVERRGKNYVYVALGINGHNKPYGFSVKSGKPTMNNPYKHLCVVPL